jgi:lipoprotein-anchoring transpeptidase ErfK/SrfK
MNPRRRDLVVLAVLLAMVVGAALGGYAVVRARASGASPSQVLAPVTVPSPAATGGTAADFPQWRVGKAVGPVTVYRQPSSSARVLTRLGKFNKSGYPTLVLVDKNRDVNGVSWAKVWVAMPPNETRGWVRGQLSFYTTSAKIVIDLSQRRLMVYRRGALRGTFPVAVGRPSLPTPTGFYFVNEKLRPSFSGGSYGVLALGISAFQPKRSNLPPNGQVAIHGTDQDYLIGKPVSHGCVRMHNKDILQVSRLVPAGSPVVIQK